MRLLKLIFSITAFWMFTTSQIAAQNTLQKFSKIIEEFDKGILTSEEASEQMMILYEGDQIYKCATPIYSFINKYRTKSTVDKIFSKNISQSSLATYVSPLGKFEFTYETTGVDAVPTIDSNSNGIPDYVERAAEAADFSYQKQIQELGFPDPIPTGQTYSISFRDFSFYGITQTSSSSPSGTVIVLENDFDGFPANDDPEGDQYGALKVTIAHEWKHAIQFVQNNFSGDSDKWAEMDATLLEEMTYDEVNDYYNYLDGFADNPFNDPGVSVIPGFNKLNYEDVTWALFFTEYYDEFFWTDVWKRIEDSNANLAFLVAVNREVEERGDNFARVLSRLYTWHYSSGINTIMGYGFDESSNYPSPKIEMQYNSVSGAVLNNVSISRFASNYFEVSPASEDGQVTIDLDFDNPTIELGVSVYFKNGTTAQNFYSAEQLESETIFTPYLWDEIEKVGLVITNTDFNVGNTFSFIVSSETPKEIILSQNYPNPFNGSSTIPISIVKEGIVRIEIFDITGRYITNIFEETLSEGVYEIPFDASNLASGVYLYRLKTGDETKFKKMTVIK